MVKKCVYANFTTPAVFGQAGVVFIDPSTARNLSFAKEGGVRMPNAKNVETYAAIKEDLQNAGAVWAIN